LLAFGATLALAEPELVVRYPNGVPQVVLTGEYPGVTYTIWRAPARGGDFAPITQAFILCLGSCYAEDRSAVPGESYRYRFDLVVPDGDAARLVSYGPFLVTISPALARPVGVYVFPNPGRGATSIQLYLAGLPDRQVAHGEAAVYDVMGRRVRLLHRGAVAPGLTILDWDGRDDRGEPLRGGIYLLRFAADGRQATARLVRR
jgi:hypothetical protein